MVESGEYFFFAFAPNQRMTAVVAAVEALLADDGYGVRGDLAVVIHGRDADQC